MATSVLVSEETRKRLAQARDVFGAASIGEAIERLLRDATPSALELFLEHKSQVLEVVRRNRLNGLTAFGSRVRLDRHPASDLDLVTSFPSDASLIDAIRIGDELTIAFGCKVDLGSYPGRDTRLAAHIEEEGVLLVPKRS